MSTQQRKRPPGPRPARELAIDLNVLHIIAAVHDVGPAPLQELRRLYGKQAVERARRAGFIEARSTLAGALYAPTGRGRAALRLDRSTRSSPDALLQGMMRRAAHTVMTGRGWQPVPRTRGECSHEPHARQFWRPNAKGGERTAWALASPYGPWPVTVRRTLDGCGHYEPLHVFAWEREAFVDLARVDPRLRVTRIADLRHELPPPLWEALQHLRQEVVDEADAA